MAFSKTKVWILILLGAALDGFTTAYLVSVYGIEHEANLIARAFMEKWGPVWGTIYHNAWGVGLLLSLWLLTYVSVEKRWWGRFVETIRESIEFIAVLRLLAPLNNTMFLFTGVALIDVVDFATLIFVSALGLVVGRRLWRL